MKPLADSIWKQRILFFLGGAGFAFVCGIIQFKWMDIVPYAAFDQQPDWVKGLREVVGWLPWIAFLLFPFGATSCDIRYYLGPERGFIGIDSKWLFITLNHDGNVNRYGLYRD